jgi:hypothetical protein
MEFVRVARLALASIPSDPAALLNRSVIQQVAGAQLVQCG